MQPQQSSTTYLEMQMMKRTLIFWLKLTKRFPAADTISKCKPTAVESEKNRFFSSSPQSYFTTPNPGRRTTDYANKVPVILGVTEDEGSLVFTAWVLAENRLKELDQKWEQIAPMAFYYKTLFPPSTLQQVSKEIREYYFGENVSISDGLHLANLETLYSDTIFRLPVMYSAMEMTQVGMEVYLYVFSYDGAWRMRDVLGLPKTVGNVSHGDDLKYLLPYTPLNKTLEPNSESVQFSKEFVKLWTSFANTGRPDLKASFKNVDNPWNKMKFNLDDLEKGIDLEFDKSLVKPELRFELLEINKQPKIVEFNVAQRLNFWKKLIKKYNNH